MYGKMTGCPYLQQFIWHNRSEASAYILKSSASLLRSGVSALSEGPYGGVGPEPQGLTAGGELGLLGRTGLARRTAVARVASSSRAGSDPSLC